MSLSELQIRFQTTDLAEIDRRLQFAHRAARIDALNIDRSFLRHYPLQRWSPEAEHYEPKFRDAREETTIGERMEAWRTMFARYTCQS